MQFDIRRFDIYRKIPKDLTEPTFTGAVISILAGFFILFLLLSELSSFLAPEIVSELFVNDASQETDLIQVKLNISLPFLNCQFVGLDIQDDLGRHDVGHVDETEKIPEGDGCRLETSLRVNRVPGNFHVSTHALGRSQPQLINMKHIIHTCSFGEDVQDVKHLPGSFNPLKGRDTTTAEGEKLSHEYLMKVVPTIYEDTWGKKKFPNQVTYMYRSYTHRQGRATLPAVWFRYDFSPITVQYHERRKPIYAFLTSLCAILGGTFTVAGIIDSFIFTASRVWKKAQIGKLG